MPCYTAKGSNSQGTPRSPIALPLIKQSCKKLAEAVEPTDACPAVCVRTALPRCPPVRLTPHTRPDSGESRTAVKCQDVWPGRAVQDGLPRSTNVRAASKRTLRSRREHRDRRPARHSPLIQQEKLGPFRCASKARVTSGGGS